MRKLAAILLMLILLFNLCGYRVAISLLQQKADNRLESRIDNSEFDESQLVEIRVALHLPYQERFTEFERHYGEIELDGRSYTYVKRKIEGDVVIFKCIANESKEKLESIQDQWSPVNGIAATGNSKQEQPSPLTKNPLVEFEQQHVYLTTLLNDEINTPHLGYKFYYLPSLFADTPDHPPEIHA